MLSDSSSVLPQHIAIIMDGNRRWAKKQGLAALKGHDYVAEEVIEKLVDHCIELGIPYITFWAFSTENWGREKAEVEGLMQLFRKSFQKNSQRLFERGVRLNTIGDLTRFPEDIQQGMKEWIEKSKKNTKITVTFALNYGGRDEILRGIQKYVQSGAQQPLDQTTFGQYLDTAGIPDPDLIIRPGGEKRLSGYLAWQGVYAELYFTDVLMPEFLPAELDKALEDYAQRQRRFGK